MIDMLKSTQMTGLLDGLAGLAAIAVVVACWWVSISIAFDLRALFLLSGTAFLVAGAVRGSAEEQLSIWHVARISWPVILGVAVFVMNDRHHRLGTPIALTVVAIVATACGILAREWWYYDPRIAAGIAGGALAALLVVPALAMAGSFTPHVRQVDGFTLSAGYRAIPSSALEGRVVVLAFWASWCGPCHEELPVLERMYEQYRGNDHVAIYAVDVGWAGETEANGEDWLRQNRISLPPAYDTGEIAKQFDVDAIPTLVLIDAKGRERFVHRGFSESEDLEAGLSKHVDELLEEGQ